MSDFGQTFVDSIEEVVGNDVAITFLKNFAIDVDKGMARKPVLIHGPPGNGKTLAAHMIASTRGWNIIEMSASDYRDSESIEKRLGVSAGTRSIFGKRNVILLDEIDELSGKFDAGAASAIGRLITSSKNPIILIANNMWEQSISFLRGKTDNVEFKKLTNADVAKILTNATKKMNASVEKDIIDALAARSSGDARSAINDLMVMIGSGAEMLEAIGMRDRKSDIFSVLDKVFTSNTLSAPLRAISTSDVDNDMMIKWMDENIPYRYRQSGDLKAAYDSLSNATKFSNRAARKQYYTYWRYMNVMMSSGIALSKSNYPDTAKRYSFPKVISALSSSKTERSTGTALAKKLQKQIHQSVRDIKSTTLPLISMATRRAVKEYGKEKVCEFFESMFDMSEKEVDSLIEVTPIS